MRTTWTSGGAKARTLGVLGANRVLVGVSAGVGREIAATVLVVEVAGVVVFEGEVRAAGLEVLEERVGGVGAFVIGVYLLEGRGQGGLVQGGVARERALLERARGVRDGDAEDARKDVLREIECAARL